MRNQRLGALQYLKVSSPGRVKSFLVAGPPVVSQVSRCYGPVLTDMSLQHCVNQIGRLGWWSHALESDDVFQL